MQLVCIGCSAWWLLCTLPLLWWCPEPVVSLVAEDKREEDLPQNGSDGLVQAAWQKLADGYGAVSGYPDLLRFLTASIFVQEGSGVVFHMSFIFALSVGAIRPNQAVRAMIWNRWVSIPFSLLWVYLLRRGVSPKLCYLSVVCLLLLSAIGCSLLRTPFEYWLLTTTLALAGSGGFTFFRSILSDLSPPDQAATIFGLSSSVGRVSGFLGPLAFGLTTDMTGDQRLGFVPIVAFLLIACLLLTRVDLERGSKRASEGVAGTVAFDVGGGASQEEREGLMSGDTSLESDPVQVWPEDSPHLEDTGKDVATELARQSAM